jgi:hypothetical protein
MHVRFLVVPPGRGPGWKGGGALQNLPTSRVAVQGLRTLNGGTASIVWVVGGVEGAPEGMRAESLAFAGSLLPTTVPALRRRCGVERSE